MPQPIIFKQPDPFAGVNDALRMMVQMKFQQNMIDKQYQRKLEQDKLKIEEQRAYEKQIKEEERSYKEKRAVEEKKLDYAWDLTKMQRTDPKTGKIQTIEVPNRMVSQFEGIGFSMGETKTPETTAFLEEFDRWDRETDPKKKSVLWERVKKSVAKTGETIELTPEGHLRIVRGAGVGDTGMTIKTQSNIQEKILNANEALARLEKLQQDYSPQFSKVSDRFFGATLPEIREKWFGKRLTPEQEQFLGDFRVYQMRALEEINLYIHEMTGAQMSAQEANRLRKGMPDIGENFWSGDGPTVFRRKLEEKINQVKSVKARYNWYKNKGLSDEEFIKRAKSGSLMDIRGMRSFINRHYNEKYNEALEEGMGQELAVQYARNQIKEMFGI